MKTENAEVFALQRELQDNKLWCRLLFWMFVFVCLILILMFYHYGKQNTNRQRLEEVNTRNATVHSADSMTRLQIEAVFARSYMVDTNDKKMTKILFEAGYKIDTLIIQ